MRQPPLVILVACALASIGAIDQERRPPAPGHEAASQPPTEARDEERVSALSLRRIRARLDRPAPPVPVSSRVRFDPTRPTYRVEIFAARQLLVPFAESLAPGWQPVVPGGLWHKEFMDMVTPPQARPYAAFRNGELLQVAATSFANAMAMRAAKKAFVSARTSRRNRRVAQIRREVESELEEVRKKSSAAATAQGRQ